MHSEEIPQLMEITVNQFRNGLDGLIQNASDLLRRVDRLKIDCDLPEDVEHEIRGVQSLLILTKNTKSQLTKSTIKGEIDWNQFRTIANDYHKRSEVIRSKDYEAFWISEFNKSQYLFSNSNREIIELVYSDLKKDTCQMIVDGCSFWYIRLVVFWRGPVMTLIPLIWDGIVRTVKAVLPGYKILRALFGKWGL